MINTHHIHLLQEAKNRGLKSDQQAPTVTYSFNQASFPISASWSFLELITLLSLNFILYLS